MKPHINSILKKGCILKAIKLDPNNKKNIDLIEQTCLEQEKVFALKKIDWDKMSRTYITI
jgi:hypothetical protein